MIDHHALYIKLKRKMIKSDIKKGDIYYASLNPVVGSEQKGERPVVVIQNNLGNKYSPTVIIAPLTELCTPILSVLFVFIILPVFQAFPD